MTRHKKARWKERTLHGLSAGFAFAIAVAGALLLGALLPALAESSATEAELAGRSAPAGEGEERAVSWLARWFQAPAERIAALRARGLDWGEISRLLLVSRKSGKSLWVILLLRDSDLSWEKIAGRFDFDAAEIERQAEEVERAARNLSRGGA